MSYEQLVESVNNLAEQSATLKTAAQDVQVQSEAARDSAQAFAIDALAAVTESQDIVLQAPLSATAAAQAVLDGLTAQTGATGVGAAGPSGLKETVQESLSGLHSTNGYYFETHNAFSLARPPSNVSSVVLKGYYKAGDGGGHIKVRITTPNPVKPWHSQTADGAWWEISASSVSLVTFGGKRTYAYDSRQALLDSIEWAKAFRKPIIDMGVYGIKGYVEITGTQVSIVGLGTVAKMGYQTYDDKRWLRRGTDTDGVLFKDKIPGLAFIFKNGGPTKLQALANRTDDYASVSPCFTYTTNGNEIRTFAIIQDNDCFDEAGAYLPLGSENTATDFNMGLLIKDGARNMLHHPTVWGYFNRSGCTVWSTPGNDDPDGNIFFGGMFAGRHGVSLLGASAPSTQVEGLSGTTFYSTTIGCKDHNSRVANVGGLTVASYYANAEAEKWRCLYIDGDVSVNTVDLAGHNFHGVILRTSANHPVELGYCSSVKFFGGIQESGDYGVPGSDTTTWLAGVNTGAGTVIEDMRVAELGAFFHAEFAGRINFKISGGVAGNGSTIFSKVDPLVVGGWSALVLGTARGVGDVSLQFTKDLTTQTSGFSLGYDSSEGTLKLWQGTNEAFTVSTQGVFSTKIATEHHGPVLTVASGVITVTHSYHPINAEGGVADDLVTINGGLVDGQLLTIRVGVGPLTIKHGTGNIRCGADKVLNSSLDRLTLEWVAASSLWVCREFQDNG
jgi:hypothetical protein